MTTPERARKIAAGLKKAHPDAHCALNHSNALELLVATVLSAQCTDERVNKVTPALFRKCRTAADYGKIPLPELETLVHSTGFYKQKAKSIQNLGREIETRFKGKVPRRMGDLITLPGVWRKTANVILGNVYGIPSIVVDTHVRRLSNRMDLSRENDPDKIESDLMKLLPEKEWTAFSHTMIFHGRRICKAAKPDCLSCPVKTLCPKMTLSPR